MNQLSDEMDTHKSATCSMRAAFGVLVYSWLGMLHGQILVHINKIFTTYD